MPVGPARTLQRSQIRRNGRLIWWEQGALTGAGPMPGSALGLHGHSVCATLIAARAALLAAALALLRETLGAGRRFCVTQMKDVLVARYLGDDSEAARHAMLAVWQQARWHLLQRVGLVPRIWNT